MPTTARGIWTPSDTDAVDFTTHLATMAGTIDTAITNGLNTIGAGANAFKGTAAQRTAFLSTAVNGMLWQDTDSIKMIWRKDGAAWVPAVWRWSGTTAQMNAFTQAPNGFEWFNTTDNSDYVRLGGAWVIVGHIFTAKQTSGSQASSIKFALAGLSASFSLASPQSVALDLTFRRYSTVAGDLVDFIIEDGATLLWKDTTQANSGGVTTGLSTSHKMIVQLGAGSHSITVSLQRVQGSGNITSAPTAQAPNMLSISGVS